MDHSWRPRPIQGGNNNSTICPSCSTSHFPFCPPHPHPSRFPGPNFEPIRDPINVGRPVYHDHSDPYHDPGHWNRNPNLPPQMGMGDYGAGNYNDVGNRGVGLVQNHGYGYGVGGYVGNEYGNSYSNVSDDRSSKRLRVDGVYPGSYGAEFDRNVAKPMVEGGDRRLGLDHGGPYSGFGFDGGVRGYAQEKPGVDRFPRYDGMRPPSSVGVGHGADYRREELEFRSQNEHGYGMERSAVDSGHGRVVNEIQSYNPQVGPYGQVAKPPDRGSFQSRGVGRNSDDQSYGFGQPNYRNGFELMPSNNAVQYDQRNGMAIPNQYSNSHPRLPMSAAQPSQMGYDPHDFGGMRPRLETRPIPGEGYQGPFGNHNVSAPPHSGPPQSGYGNTGSEHMGNLQAPQGFEFRPPLPASPPPPLPREPPPVQWSADHRPSSSPRASSSLFPVSVRSPATVHSSHAPIPETQMLANPHQRIQAEHVSGGVSQGDPQGMMTTFGQYPGGSQRLPPKNNLPDKPKTVDAAHLFKPPYRTSRPDHFVIILRGLPGSGKSYLAKMLRDLEIEHGGSAPRIHSMDDYFMSEVEKADENESSKSSVRGKKAKIQVVLEYCYESEMEEAYRSSMLKAFRKTVEEGVFTFVIVDDRNLRVADFAQFWATAKRSGYEAYVLEAPYKDPAGCTARNVHGFSRDDVEKMAAHWEEAPSLYLQLDVKSLFHGDDLKESSIQEVDMDAEEPGFDTSLSNVDGRQTGKISGTGKFEHNVSPEDEDRDDMDNSTEVKELGRSKWSDNVDDNDHERSEGLKRKANALSTLLGTYGKEGKSVHWGDQAGRTGFSIGAVKKANMASLVIGQGAGYNLKSNPLAEEDATTANSGENQKHSMFQERLRAERESFKAVFDRRRHRIGGVLVDD